MIKSLNKTSSVKLLGIAAIFAFAVFWVTESANAACPEIQQGIKCGDANKRPIGSVCMTEPVCDPGYTLDCVTGYCIINSCAQGDGYKDMSYLYTPLIRL